MIALAIEVKNTHEQSIDILVENAHQEIDVINAREQKIDITEQNGSQDIDVKNELGQVVNVEQDKATGGGVSFSLPMIRFANFTEVENEETHIYRFTVENLGGGILQVGDTLQICCKRNYPGGKQKLRKMTERIITEDDLNHRFLKIEVDPDDAGVSRWLFRNNRAGGNHSTLSAMYFRLKRVTKYNEEMSEECDAIFSNVETVWKTYYPTGENRWALNIK